MSCHKPKKSDKSKYVGIEIEFFSRYSSAYIQDLLKKNKFLSSFCKLGYDGSIRVPWARNDNDGLELRILCKTTQLASRLAAVRKFLNKIEAQANKSCGLHVHLDARHVDAEKMFKNLTKELTPIEKSVPPYRLKGTYAKSIKNDVNSMLEMLSYYKRGLNNTSYRQTGDGVRIDTRVYNYLPKKYRSINIECMLRYKTIEVRCHEGTINCAEIYQWCQYLCEVAYAGKVSKGNESYIQKRIKSKGEYEAKTIAS